MGVATGVGVAYAVGRCSASHDQGSDGRAFVWWWMSRCLPVRGPRKADVPHAASHTHDFAGSGSPNKYNHFTLRLVEDFLKLINLTHDMSAEYKCKKLELTGLGYLF